MSYTNGGGTKVTNVYTLTSILESVIAYIPGPYPASLSSPTDRPIAVVTYAESPVQGDPYVYPHAPTVLIALEVAFYHSFIRIELHQSK